MTCNVRYGVQMSASERERSVGLALRRLREREGRNVKETAATLAWSSSKLSRIETAASRVRSTDLERLLDLYGPGPEDRSAIEDLANGSSDLSIALPEPYARYADLEARASRISMYAAVVVPGLLQIPEYADEVIRATPEPEDALAPERLKKRLERQGVFASPVALDVIIDEAVLRREIGGEGVMRRQIARLREFTVRPHTTVRVLPFAVGAHPALTGQFAILDFLDQEEPCAFCDGLTGGVLRRRAEEVRRYRACFAALQKLALSIEESSEVLASIPS
jgi:hypothetical protein